MKLKETVSIKEFNILLDKINKRMNERKYKPYGFYYESNIIKEHTTIYRD